jgi:hypothetical protein
MSAQTEAVAAVPYSSSIRRAVIAALALAFVFPAALIAQSSASSDFSSSQPAVAPSDDPQQSSTLPPAPTPQDKPSTTQSSEPQGRQTSRILGVIPNFRAVSSTDHLPPQTVKQKFVTASEDSFDYSSIAVPVAVAYVSYLRNSTPEFGTGGIGYARYLWHTAADQTQENFFVEFIVPAAAHEDTRFYTLGHGSFFKRTGYALSRVVVTRSDAGAPTFNFAEVLGSGLSAGLSNAYYPSATRSFSNTADQWGLNIAVDALAFLVKEFWPDVNHRLFHSGDQPSTPPSH